MTIVLGWWALPTILSMLCLFMMLRPDPYAGGSAFNLTPLFRALWLIPALFVWVVYLVVSRLL